MQITSDPAEEQGTKVDASIAIKKRMDENKINSILTGSRNELCYIIIKIERIVSHLVNKTQNN